MTSNETRACFRNGSEADIRTVQINVSSTPTPDTGERQPTSAKGQERKLTLTFNHLSQLLSASTGGIISFAPMGRLDIDVPSTPSVDPIGSVLVTRKWERVDDTIIVQHSDFEISVRWRYRSGLPFGGE